MSRKIFTAILVLVLFVLAFLGTPFIVQAGGVCGGTYIVEQGQTLESIATTCGTTVDIIRAANPGISGALSAGQALTVPGINYIVPGTPVPSTSIPVTSIPSTPRSTPTIPITTTILTIITTPFPPATTAHILSSPVIRSL
jgi:LysM repeat protein